MNRVVTVLGVTGRLGPAVARAFEGCEVRGLSRREPRAGESLGAHVRFVLGDRRNVAVLASMLEGADVVIDLLTFAIEDADTLLDALARTHRPPRHLLVTSSIAELGPRYMNEPEGSGFAPEDEHGQGLLAARRRYESAFKGAVHTLILPRLIATVDASYRERPYLDTARSTGRALVAGSGGQPQTIAPVEGVAEVIVRLVESPNALPTGPLHVGPPAPVTVLAAVQALLEGAHVDAPPGRHPDPEWRGPYGSGAEVLDTSRLQRLFPTLAWPDVLDAHRRHGAWLASQPTSRRPMRVIPVAHQEYRGRDTVDVHDRRAEPPPGAVAAISELVDWLTPAFYLDLGRPCNAACIYCSVPPHGDTEGFTPVERLVEVVKAGQAVGCDRAIFIGGEPTIHPELQTVLSTLHDAGFGPEHAMMTNGLRLSDEGFLERLVEGGVRTFHVSVDTSDEDVYNRLARSKGQFTRQRAGLSNVLERTDVNAYVYTVVTKLNAPSLVDHLLSLRTLSDALGRAHTPTVVMAFAKPLGDALTHADELLVGPSERARIAREAHTMAEAIGMEVGFRNLQPCLAPELRPWIVDEYLHDFSVDVRSRQALAYAHDVEYKLPVAACEGCVARSTCSGVYREDARRHGDGAYVTITLPTTPPAASPAP